MKLYLAVLEVVDQEQNKAYKAEHNEYVDKKVEENKIAFCGPFLDGSGGAIVYIADSYEEAYSLASSDPLVSNHARSLKLQEWGMKKKNDPFAK
ncbi:YciI family protein [Paenibacillus sp. Dod16]|uniref:YciI family protein n=1 Tax=Paenibacillus sp. Dod16 TaxID=3416392 RepID=UPI003CE70DC2